MCGGLRGRSTLQLAQLGRQAIARAKRRKVSSALVFVDSAVAFYSALAEKVVGPVMGKEERVDAKAGAQQRARIAGNDRARRRVLDQKR